MWDMVGFNPVYATASQQFIYSRFENGAFLSTQKRLTSHMGFIEHFFISTKNVSFQQKSIVSFLSKEFIPLSSINCPCKNTAHSFRMHGISFKKHSSCNLRCISSEGFFQIKQKCHSSVQYSLKIAAFCQGISFHSKMWYLFKTVVSAYDAIFA